MSIIEETIQSYKNFLFVKYSKHEKTFHTRHKNNNESTIAEAILFATLRADCDEVFIEEDASTGGADFLCTVSGNKFVVEVTCLESTAVERQSGIKKTINNEVESCHYAMLTDVLRTKASGKAGQLSEYGMPRVLAITTLHRGGDAIIGMMAAQNLLTGDPMFAVSTTETNHEARIATDLKGSVFFRFNNDTIEPCRRSISAIILVHILRNKCNIVGVLHPDPVYVFPISLLPKIPFVRLKSWPPNNGCLETEWVIDSPEIAEFYFRPISFKEEELKTA